MTTSTLPLDRYVLETLMPDLVSHDRRPSAFIVYLALWSRTNGARQRAVSLSLRELAESTGLSKRTVQDALRKLVRRRLIGMERGGTTAIPTYSVMRPWVRKKG